MCTFAKEEKQKRDAPPKSISMLFFEIVQRRLSRRLFHRFSGIHRWRPEHELKLTLTPFLRQPINCGEGEGGGVAVVVLFVPTHELGHARVPPRAPHIPRAADLPGAGQYPLIVALPLLAGLVLPSADPSLPGLCLHHQARWLRLPNFFYHCDGVEWFRVLRNACITHCFCQFG